MRRKRDKDYWDKRHESFCDGTDAKSRAATLRTHQRVTHVKVSKHGSEYVVSYSVARWYVNELKKAGGTL